VTDILEGRLQPPAHLTSTPTPSVAAITTVSALDAVTKPRHRWYFFKEAFSPDVVDKAVADAGCQPGDLVVDPFCGSGTVPLQAAFAGQPSVGREVNPFLAFVARAKLADCRVQPFQRAADAVLASARRGMTSPLSTFSTFAEDSLQAQKQEKWLFNRAVLESFEGAWCAVGATKTASSLLVRLCLLGAATDVSNATKDGKALRYRSDWQNRAFGSDNFIDAYLKRVDDVAADLRVCPIDAKSSTIRLGDSRKGAPSEKFKLCVTSPPYLNSFDYTDVYRPELFLGKWVNSMEQLRALRLRTLRSHVQVHWPDPTEDDFGTHYREIVEQLRAAKSSLWNARIPVMVQAYFQDIRHVLKKLRAAARDDASLWLVVSTSAYGGVEIPVDLIIADIGSKCGWYLREVSVLRHLGRVAGQQWKELSEKKENSSPHLRESVVILDAAPKAGMRQHP